MTGRPPPGAAKRKPGRALVAGNFDHLGSIFDGDGVNFAVYSDRAEALTLCLFDAGGRKTEDLEFTQVKDGVWHGYLPGCRAGQRYGYRAHGPYAREKGLRFNRHKLLVDPYARAFDGEFRWSPAVFDFRRQRDEFLPDTADSAAFVPKSVVTGGAYANSTRRPGIPWSKTLLYEANLRGYTMRHPQVPKADRGRFRGMANAKVLEYLKSLGVTSIELQPVQEFIDEERLAARGLRNYWGYNCVNFFVPARRYAGSEPIAEFREMVNAIHDAGLEVILDVAFNHTGESDADGPTLGFRGLDNLSYYRTVPGEPGAYVNDTGCGNTVNADHPRVRELLLEALRYWVNDMGADGFRFDLAPVLGRSGAGFDPDHPLLQAISSDRILKDAKLIAEPWDPGPGGYQLGRFPPGWREWNDRYRDAVRRFWRGDAGVAPEFARRLHGSADVFESAGRGPLASVNFVTAHDGYTLYDLVSYESRHNEANGEGNRDGHTQNFSCNHGVEGDTADPSINAMRRRQRLNMLGTLLFSQGVPMLLAGDEFGHTQLGNNNAYAQDNETTWLNWPRMDADLLRRVREFIGLRQSIDLAADNRYRHGATRDGIGLRDVEWLRPDGNPVRDEDWPNCAALTVIFAGVCGPGTSAAIALMFNTGTAPASFRLPEAAGKWRLAVSSADNLPPPAGSHKWELPGHTFSCALLEYGVSRGP